MVQNAKRSFGEPQDDVASMDDYVAREFVLESRFFVRTLGGTFLF